MKINYISCLIILFLILFQFKYSVSQTNVWDTVSLPLIVKQINCSFYDVSENKLFVGGRLLNDSNSIQEQSICIYDGANWDTMGVFNNQVQSIIRYDGNLYIGGHFTEVNGQQMKSLVVHNGVSWESAGNFNAPVFNLKVIDNELYVMGSFTYIDSLQVNGIAKWDGNNWQSVYNFYGGSASTIVKDVSKYNNTLIIAGNFYNSTLDYEDIAMYQNGTWQKMGVGLLGGFTAVNKMLVYKDELYIGGLIRKTDGNVGHGIQRWNGTQWREVGTGVQDINNTYNSISQIWDMEVYNNELYVSGGFFYAGNTPASTLAKWDGNTWCGFGINSMEFTINRPIVFYQNTFYASANAYDPIIGYYPLFIKCNKLYTDTCSIPMGINEEASANALNIYPNPASNSITINLPENTSELSIYNYAGQLVEQKKISNKEQVIQQYVASYPSGIYLLQVQGQDAVQVKKFVKQ